MKGSFIVRKSQIKVEKFKNFRFLFSRISVGVRVLEVVLGII